MEKREYTSPKLDVTKLENKDIVMVSDPTNPYGEPGAMG